MQYRDSRQEVTGLVVNRKVNVRNEYRRLVKAMTHRLLTKGEFEFVHRSIDASGGEVPLKIPGKRQQLHGMLGFIASAIGNVEQDARVATRESRRGIVLLP
jgi:hypothetical protein